MIEFDPAATSTESTIVRYFKKGLKPSIKNEINQDATHLNNYKKLVAKAVRAEAKASLQLSFYVQKTDPQIPRGSWLAHTTAHKVQTQGAVKDHCEDKSKAKNPVSTPAQDSKPFNKAKKDKKKKQYRDKKNFREPRDFTILAFGVNAAKVKGKKKKNKKNVSEIMYFNCNKKEYYVNRCSEQLKN